MSLKDLFLMHFLVVFAICINFSFVGSKPFCNLLLYSNTLNDFYSEVLHTTLLIHPESNFPYPAKIFILSFMFF